MHASLPGISLFRLPNLIIVQVNVVCIRLSLPCRVRVALPIDRHILWSNNNRLTEMVPPWLFQIPRVYCIFLSGGEVSRVTLAGVFRVENTESERNGLCTYYYSGSDEFWSWVQCREEQPPERSHFLMRESDNNAFQKKIHNQTTLPSVLNQQMTRLTRRPAPTCCKIRTGSSKGAIFCAQVAKRTTRSQKCHGHQASLSSDCWASHPVLFYRLISQ